MKYFAFPHEYFTKNFKLKDNQNIIDYIKFSKPYDTIQYFRKLEDAEFIVPLIEENVLECGKFNSKYALGDEYLSYSAALLCSDKLLQRKKLDELGELNVKYYWYSKTFNKNPYVIKNRTSSLNKGVRIITKDLEEKSWNIINKMVDGLKTENNRLNFFNYNYYNKPYFFEEYIDGDHYEMDGVVISMGMYFTGNLIKQHWKDDKIVWYEKVDDHILSMEVGEIVCKILRLFQLNKCGFSMEFIKSKNGFKIIEVHARLGEEVEGKNYKEAIGADLEAKLFEYL
ncbi:MAG: hypothetical protein ACOCVF_01740 [bacterium]